MTNEMKSDVAGTEVADIEVGKTYFFQTVTHNYVGMVEASSPAFVRCSELAAVFETGPYSDFFQGRPKICEPCAPGLIPIGALTYVGDWPWPIPTKAIGL